MKLNKKQKRTATIASMAALLAVVLGMGGQTFAKYIETETAKTGQVTVAKWGVVINANFDSLFAKEYYSASSTSTKGSDSDTISVSSSSKTVAPGTKGSVSIDIKGQPEVSSKITVTATGLDIGIYPSTPASGTATYAPVKWTVNDGLSNVVENGTIADIETYFNNNVEGTFGPGTELDKAWTISWAWAFSTSDDNDELDTYLGNVAAGIETDSNVVTSFTFDLKIQIEQVD